MERQFKEKLNSIKNLRHVYKKFDPIDIYTLLYIRQIIRTYRTAQGTLFNEL